MKWMLMILRIGNDVQTKGWYASKTVWFNILSLVAAVAALKGLELSADDVVALSAGVSTVGNILLRFATDTPIGAKTVPVELPAVTAPVAETIQPERPFNDGNIMG